MPTPTSVRFSGAFTALVTPFSADATRVDVEALEKLVEAQIQGGIQGLVPCGTTGEAATLSDAEFIEIIRRTVQVARGRVPVIAGSGSFSTKETIATSLAALEAGADGVMLITPYYTKPTQAGLIEHMVAVAGSVPAPVVLYNVPARTGVDLGADATVAICERAANVVALKDASGNVLRCQELVRRLGDRLAILCGDDALTLPMMACGARGVISVTSNVLPAAVSDVCRLALRGDFAAARSAHLSLLPLHGAMFIEANPSPVKAALAHKGLTSDAVRLPLVRVTQAARSQIESAIARYEAGP